MNGNMQKEKCEYCPVCSGAFGLRGKYHADKKKEKKLETLD